MGIYIFYRSVIIDVISYKMEPGIKEFFRRLSLSIGLCVVVDGDQYDDWCKIWLCFF